MDISLEKLSVYIPIAVQEILEVHPYNKKVLEAISGAEERLKRESE